MFPSIQTTDGERKDSVEEKTNARPKSRTSPVGAGVLWTQRRPLCVPWASRSWKGFGAVGGWRHEQNRVRNQETWVPGPAVCE